MTDNALALLRPATRDKIANALTFSLQYNGRKRMHEADQAMARITTDRLIWLLLQSGVVLMKGSPSPTPITSGMLSFRSGSDD